LRLAQDELEARPEGVRGYRQPQRPGFADCAPTGRVRLDALARWLQDVAYADVEDAGVAQAAVWVVRRTRIRVNRFPRFGERFELVTFCSGLGRMWAERRTDITSAGGAGEPADVQAVSLWIHLDPERWVPTPVTEPELAVYRRQGPMAERKVGHRLRHPGPERVEGEREWIFRATECDLADHVNNAAYWTPLEEELLAGPEPERIDVELEYRTPAQPGAKRVLAAGDWRWIVGPRDEVHASVRLG
jgi:acyl-ACP thioesterase